MKELREPAIIAAMTAVTFAIRFSFYALGDRIVFPAWARRALAYVPAAVLTAIIAPMILYPGGNADFGWRNPWIAGALASVAASLKLRNATAALAAGMIFFTAWKLLFA